MQERDVFLSAIELTDDARRAYLDQACGSDLELRRKVEALFAAYEQAGKFLAKPAVEETGAFTQGEEGETPRRQGTEKDPLPGKVLAGRYKLLERIGQGGMGSIYVAEQSQPVRRKVAIKIIKLGMDTGQVLARFEAERQALALMDHPNIAKVLDGGMTNDHRPFFVMEYVKGDPLNEFCDKEQLTVKQRLDLFIQVCQAVQHAHQKGIIHRDLKPSNILVCLYDGKPVPKVIDFGLAKALHQPLTDRTLHTGHGMVLGTPLYMSPEQAEVNNFDVDTRTDIYALGVILYELLTGTTPLEKQRYRKAAWDEVLRIIREEEPPKPSTKLSGSNQLASLSAQRKLEPGKLAQLLSGDLDWIVMKALEKDRNRRYETANGFAMDIQRYLADEPVSACPPTLGYRLRKLYRKNRPVVLATVAFVGLLMASVITATVLAIQARSAERVALVERQRAIEGELEAKGQRDRAEREQKRAEEEKRASEAVRKFLQDDLLRQADLFVQADAMPQAGSAFEIKPNPTIRDLLDRAAAQLTPELIEKKFPAMPFVQAEVLHAVASAYGSVAEEDRGRPLVERAIPLYRAVRGDHDPATLQARKSQLKLSIALPAEQKDALLISYIEDATRVLGPRDREVLEARMVQACGLYLNNRTSEAIPALKKIRTEMTEVFGPTDILTLTCGAALAQAYATDKQFQAAVREMEGLRDTIKGMPIRFDHPLLETGYVLLAEAYHDKGDIQKTIEVYEEILEGWKRRGQPYHTNTWRTRHLLAWVYARNGNLPQGAKLFEANLAAAPSSFNAYLSWDGLREAEVKLGRDDKALVERARQGLAAAIGSRGANYKSWVTGHARIRLGQQLLRMKDYAEAEAMLTAGLREMIEEYPHIREYSLNAIPEGQRSLLDLYKETNRQSEGAKNIAEIWAALEKIGEKALSTTTSSRIKLAWEVMRENPAVAVVLFEQNVRLAVGPVDRCKALYGLHHAELNLGKLDAALDHARQALDALVLANGSTHRDFLTGQMRAAVGLVLVRQKKLDEAEPFLSAGCREIADYFSQIPDYEYPYISEQFEILIKLYRDTNQPEKEKEWFAFKRETFDKLICKNIASGILTANAVKLVHTLVMDHIHAGRHDDAFALFSDLQSKHSSTNGQAASDWMDLSLKALDTYKSLRLPDQVKRWATLRVPALERELADKQQAKRPEPEVLRTAKLLAFAYADASRNMDAVKLFEETVARQKANGWQFDADSLLSYTTLRTAVIQASNPELAVEMTTHLLTELAKRPGTPKEQMAREQFILGHALSAAGKHADAEPALREAVRLQDKIDPKHWQTAKFKLWLGIALLEQNKLSEGEPIVSAAYTDIVDRLATMPLWEKHLPITSAERLAKLYERLDKPEEVKKWQAEQDKVSTTPIKK